MALAAVWGLAFVSVRVAAPPVGPVALIAGTAVILAGTALVLRSASVRPRA